MATEIVGGQTKWSGGRDEDGHRTYKLHVQTAGSRLDGPAAHLQTPGLPLPGSVWAYDNDLDVYAWCNGACQVTPREDRGNYFYDHVYTFTTRPRGQQKGGGGGGKDDRGQKKRCADQTIQDPLAEPPRRSGGFVRASEEYRFDRLGYRLKTTSFEPITGPQAEFDRSRSQVTVEFNDPLLNYAKYSKLKDTVNEKALWDLPARCWKLCEWHWECKLYGTCFFYYTHRFVFESNTETVLDPTDRVVYDLATDQPTTIPYGTVVSRWDHFVPDESSLAIFGEWDPASVLTATPVWTVLTAAEHTKPGSYDVIPSPRGGGNIRRVLSRTTRGAPASSEDDELVWLIKAYQEADFLAQIPRLPATL